MLDLGELALVVSGLSVFHPTVRVNLGKLL